MHSFLLDHDYGWADGLICGGRMAIVTQPVRGPEPLGYFRAMDRALEEGEGFTEAIVINPEAVDGLALGSRFLFDGQGGLGASWPTVPASTPIASRVLPVDDRPRPRVEGGVAYLPSWPRIRLVIVGAGHVGQAVAGLAAQAEFDVWVVDDRQQYANSERFPSAQRILVGPIEETLASMEINTRTYALIVTRGHGHDQEALYHLAPTAASYVGLIGSRRKIRLIFEGLRDQGIAEADLRRVSAPVGLDIGSQSVIEIGISIVAELIARRNLGPQGIAARPHGRARKRRTTRPARAPAMRGRHDRRRGARRGPERPHGTTQAADDPPGRDVDPSGRDRPAPGRRGPRGRRRPARRCTRRTLDRR